MCLTWRTARAGTHVANFKNTCGGASWRGCDVGCFRVLVKWITASPRRGTVSIYGSEKRLADTTRGYSDLRGSPRLRKSASASPNQRFCLGAVLAFFISKPHSCWWLISPALLQGAALTFRRQTTGLAHCAHLLMKWKSLYKWQKVCKLFINHFWVSALYDFGAMKMYYVYRCNKVTQK